MNELKELINVVSKHKVKQIEVIGNDLSRRLTQSFRQLYDAVNTTAMCKDRF